jgi:hypothetical protein
VDKTDLLHFTKRTEMLISPKAVGKLYQRAEMLGKLPLSIQKWIVGRVGRDEQQIGFVVEPYAYFLAYEITDLDAARAQLPPDYELVPTAIFEGTRPRHAAIIAAFNVHTSVFWGSRVEFYVIAENQRTGLLSWVICDYESNTISYDPGRGFSAASTSHNVVTTTHAGDLIVDVKGASSGHHLASSASLESAAMRPLDQRLWLEGNLSVDYGGRLLDPDAVPFGLVFDPGEVQQALEIPLEAVVVERNTYVEGLLASEPFEACTFPYAQHYQTSSFPAANPVTDRDGLEEAVNKLSAPGR